MRQEEREAEADREGGREREGERERESERHNVTPPLLFHLREKSFESS